jgi:hypothetical protein
LFIKSAREVLVFKTEFDPLMFQPQRSAFPSGKSSNSLERSVTPRKLFYGVFPAINCSCVNTTFFFLDFDFLIDYLIVALANERVACFFFLGSDAAFFLGSEIVFVLGSEFFFFFGSEFAFLISFDLMLFLLRPLFLGGSYSRGFSGIIASG